MELYFFWLLVNQYFTQIWLFKNLLCGIVSILVATWKRVRTFKGGFYSTIRYKILLCIAFLGSWLQITFCLLSTNNDFASKYIPNYRTLFWHLCEILIKIFKPIFRNVPISFQTTHSLWIVSITYERHIIWMWKKY